MERLDNDILRVSLINLNTVKTNALTSGYIKDHEPAKDRAHEGRSFQALRLESMIQRGWETPLITRHWPGTGRC
jgi:hypothetical protein